MDNGKSEDLQSIQAYNLHPKSASFASQAYYILPLNDQELTANSNSLISRSLRPRDSWWRIDRINVGKVSQEGFQREETAEYALISRQSLIARDRYHKPHLVVTKKREIDARNHCYGDVELRARQSVELLHDGSRSQRFGLWSVVSSKDLTSTECCFLSWFNDSFKRARPRVY